MDDRSPPRGTGDVTADAAPVVHVVDDDEGVRLALDSLLRSVGHRVRGHATAEAFLAEVAGDAAGAAGCLVLDVRLPGIGGLDFQDDLARRGLGLPVVLMTGHGDIPMSVRGMKAGAVDFLPKPFRDQDMLDAVAAALARDTERRARDGRAAALRAQWATLSAREQEVARLAATGLLNKQIAFDLGLSEITVKIHRGKAMRKLGLAHLPDLVRAVAALDGETAAHAPAHTPMHTKV